MACHITFCVLGSGVDLAVQLWQQQYQQQQQQDITGILTCGLNMTMQGLQQLHAACAGNSVVVTATDLWWRVVMVIVCLIVLVPLIASVHPVEVFRLAGAVLVMPPVDLRAATRQSEAGGGNR